MMSGRPALTFLFNLKLPRGYPTRLTEMTADAYLLGKHTLLELLDAEQTRREIYREQIETTSALIEAQIHLLAATGRLPDYLKSAH